MKTELPVKVYYEDTDCLGMVYHANYLKYFERGRTELIGSLGQSLKEWNEAGFNFAIFKMVITWHKPGLLGDECIVKSKLFGKSEFRMKVQHHLFRDGVLLTEAVADLVCLDENMDLREFPEEMLALVSDVPTK